MIKDNLHGLMRQFCFSVNLKSLYTIKNSQIRSLQNRSLTVLLLIESIFKNP